MTEWVAPVLAASALLVAAWIAQPGRRAVAIRRYVELLNDLPESSAQRQRLANEIDSMIDGELDWRRTVELSQVLMVTLATGTFAIVTSSIARSLGGIWWLIAVIAWLCLFASLAIVIAGLIRSAARLIRDKRSGTSADSSE